MNFIYLIILVIIIIVIYFVIKTNNPVKRNFEKFTLLMGITNPMTSYDDYGTFNFIMQTDDLPFYDKKMDKFFDETPYKIETTPLSVFRPTIWDNNDFNVDSFINVFDKSIRRVLIPGNYAAPTYAQTDYEVNNNVPNPRIAPEPYNYYFVS